VTPGVAPGRLSQFLFPSPIGAAEAEGPERRQASVSVRFLLSSPALRPRRRTRDTYEVTKSPVFPQG